MVVRFDEQARRVTLSVRDLADENDYRFHGPSALSLKRRAALGRAVHESHQGAREDEVRSYRRERSIRFETEVAGWTAVVTGRIDGVFTDPAGRTVIEEVKTIIGSDAEVEGASASSFPAYTWQLQLYRHLLEAGSAALGFQGGPAPEIALHLVLIALPSRHRRTLELDYDAAACRSLVQRRLTELVARRDATRAREQRRQAARPELRFPHAALRPHQDDMVADVEQALGQGRPILVSAPPGIGKTAGALVPALRHAARIGGRVFVATSKTTQQAIVARTVELMRGQGSPVRAVVLQAREKACLNDVVHCHPDACEYARDYGTKLVGSGAVERLLARGVADAAALEEEARAHRFCPFEAGLDLTSEVEVVIGDYNYVFDPGAALKRMFVEEEPKDVVLVIDEAHNLHERGMEYYSPVLRRELLRDLDRGLAAATDPVRRQARALLQRLLGALDEVEHGEASAAVAPAAPPPPPPENLLLFDDPQARARPASRKLPVASRTLTPAPAPAPTPTPSGRLPVPPKAPLAPEREVTLDLGFFTGLRDELSELAVAWFAQGKERKTPRKPGEDDPLVVLNRVVSRFVQVLEMGGDELSTLFRAHDGGSLKVLCKDPSRQLGKRIRACGGAVAVSATLEPLEFYRDVLGFGRDAVLRAYPSPFDRRRRKVIVLDRPSTSFHERERDLPIVEDAVRAVVASRPGNYLVCCPSFEYLEKLAPRLRRLPGFELIVHPRAIDDAGRRAVLERLDAHAQGKAGAAVLLTVQGGVFTEGVDYPGERCIGAIVVGPGLPRVSFERGLIQAHFQRVHGRGFDYAFLFPGMSKVIQSAGRVIRTPTDEGVVVLVGDRFATDRYAALFPRDWYERSPRELISRDPYGDLGRFWAERRAAAPGAAAPPPGSTPAPPPSLSTGSPPSTAGRPG